MNQSIATRLEDPTEPLAVKPLGAAQALQSEAQTTALPRDFLIEAPMRPDPIDTRRHTSGAPPPRAVGDWLAAACGAAAGLCAMAVLLDFRVPDVRPEKSIAAHPPALTHIAEPAATPVADAAPRIPATRKVQIAARRLPAVEAEPEYELVSDPVLVKAQLVAALDRSLTERNANVAGERTPVTVMRVGQPRVAFDPSGTSASVTYRKRFVYSRPEGSGQSIVDEQLFFANIDGSWQLIDRVSGPQASPYR